MTDPASGLSVLHVIVRAGPTNCQYNEHVLPVVGWRHVTVCSLFPADVVPPRGLTLHEGDGSVRGGARALRRALTSDTYDVVHVHAPASAMLTLAVYRKLRRPREDLVFTIHNSWRNFRFRNRLFLRVVLALFPLVVVCGQAAFDSLPRRLVRRTGDRLAVVANGVDVDRVHRVLSERPTPAPSRRNHRALTVVSLNRLIPLKDPGTLLRAFARVHQPGDRLVMIGDGALRPRVESEIRARGLSDCVTLTGIIPRDEVYRRLAGADLFVSTSGGEGLPVALLEAMACEVPVIVSDIPPHREVSRAAGGLPLVETRDDAGFARAIERVRALDQLDRHAIGRHLGEVVGEHYSVHAMNNAYGALYRQLVDHRQGPQPDKAARRRTGSEIPLGEKLKQHIFLLTLVTILGAAVGFGIAYVQAPVYKGETSVRVGSVTADEEALKASAALAAVYADLARREPVLGPLVETGDAADWKKLQPDVYSRVGDKNPQLVEISYYASDRERAREMADAVATSLERFVNGAVRSSDGAFLSAQMRALRADIAVTSRQLAEARAQLRSATPEGEAAARERVDALLGTLAEQRSGYADLRTLDGADSGTLTRVDEAWTVRSPLRPTPVVLAVAGAAAALVVAIGWLHVFGRGRTPRAAVPGSAPQPHGPTPLRDLRSHRNDGRPRVNPWAGPEPLRQQPEQRTRASER